MSEKKTATAAQAVTDPMEELVDFAAPYDPTGASRDVILAVNGELIRVKRGSTVQVKRKFLEVWTNANEQTMAAQTAMEKAREGGKAPTLEL